MTDIYRSVREWGREWVVILLQLVSFTSVKYEQGLWLNTSGPWFSKKMASYQYRKSGNCGDKTILRPSYMYLHNGISYTGKTTSLYWIRALLHIPGQCHICWLTGPFIPWIRYPLTTFLSFKEWQKMRICLYVSLNTFGKSPWLTIRYSIGPLLASSFDNSFDCFDFPERKMTLRGVSCISYIVHTVNKKKLCTSS